MAVALSVSAQKYGHLNYGNLLSAMPEVKTANTELETYRQQLITRGEAMAKKFQENYTKFVADVQSGDLAPVTQTQRQQALEQEQQSILAYEQEVAQKVEQKRQELLMPIIDKMNNAIEAVAKENGYVLIFDTSVFNAILFADASEDVLGKVKAKLGL